MKKYKVRYNAGDWAVFSEAADIEYDCIVDADVWDANCRNNNNKIVGCEFVPNHIPGDDDFDCATQHKQAELNVCYEAFLSSVQPEYTALERDTWHKQFEQACAIKKDPEIPDDDAPLVSSIAAMRSDVTRLDLAQRIINNDAMWQKIAGYVTGQRHNFQKQLDAATTVEEIEAITVTFSLPEEAA